MAGLILAHIVQGAVDLVIAKLLGQERQGLLFLAGVQLDLDTVFHVLFDIVHQLLTQDLSQPGRVADFLHRHALKRIGNLGIALPIRLTGHGHISPRFDAFLLILLAQSGYHALIHALRNAQRVHIGPLRGLLQPFKLILAHLANRAEFRRFIPLVDIPAHLTDPFHSP